MINKLECTCIEAYTTRNMRDPNCCACSCDHNDLVEQLAQANERVAELEKDILRQSVFMEKTAEKLEQHQEWQATASVLRRPTREAKQALNQFAIEQQIKGAQRVLDCKELNLSQGEIDTIKLIQEQLRKEQGE